MTIAIPKGVTLIAENGVSMVIGDDSTAEVIGVDGDVLTVKFEDGDDYTVTRGELGANRAIYVNPGNNVTSRNGVKCAGSISGRSS